MTADRYDRAVEAIDAANAADPNRVVVRGTEHPLAWIHGRLAAEWVPRLVDGPPGDAVLLAARAHHLRRWEVPRSAYPEGKAGYHRWKRDQRARHATEVAEVLAAAGYDDETIADVQAYVRRDDLAGRAGSQAVEDAACLVFLETQLVAVSGRLERDHLVDVLRRTARKMSTRALSLAAEIPLGDERELLDEALAGSAG